MITNKLDELGGSASIPVVGEKTPEILRILLIDDDRKFARLLANYLAPSGYEIVAVHDGLTGIKRGSEESWALIMLDVMLPGLDGFEVLKRLRMVTAVPLMMVTARGEESDRIVGLEMGADDYVPKTFSSRELLARIRSLLRRARGDHAEIAQAHKTFLTVGEMKLDLSGHRAFIRNHEIALTPIEFNLLRILVQAKSRAKSREQLLAEVTDRKVSIQGRSIDVHISTLRRKLGDSGETGTLGYIRTVRGVGYMLLDPNEREP